MSILLREDVHLIDYLRVLYKRRVFFVVIMLLAIGTAAVVTKGQVPVYASRANILVDTEATLIEFPGISQHRRMRLDTEMLLMRSREVAERAVRSRLGRELDPKEPAFDRLVDEVRARTAVEVVKNTLVVEMKVLASDPEKARDWCDAMAESYVELNFEATKSANSVGATAMRDEIERTERTLELAERKLLDFKIEHNVVSEETKQRTQETIQGSGTAAVVQNEQKRIEAEHRYRALLGWYRANDFSLPLPTDLAPSPLVIGMYGDIVKARTELNALLLKYREQHPKVQEVKGALSTLQANFDRELKASLSVLEKQAQLYTTIGRAHETALEGEKQQFLKDNERDWLYRTLERNVKVKEDLYRTLLAKLGELNVASTIVQNNVRVVDHPKAIPIPIRPNWKFNLLAGMAFGFATAVAGAFFLEYLDKTLKTPDDIAHFLELPVLAVVPIARAELLVGGAGESARLGPAGTEVGAV